MTAITDIAKGKLCQIRLPGCTSNPETTVPAHFSLSDVSGRGIKSPSTCVAWACGFCHDLADGRVKSSIPRETIRLAHALGVIRTLAILDSMGYELKLVGGERVPKILPRRYG